MPANDAETLDDDARQKAYAQVNTIMRRWSKDLVVEPNGIASYKPQPTDVIINSYMKSGTTFMQQTLYQIAVLTNGGPPEDPDGTAKVDISYVVPLLEFAPGLGCPDPKFTPRVFKSHAPRALYPPGTQKHVCVVRDPSQVAGSLLDFFGPAFLGEGYVDSDAKTRRFLYDNHTRIMMLGLKTMEDGTPAEETDSPFGAWVDHLAGCINNMDDKTMIVFYDDFCNSTEKYVRRLAAFMGCSVSDEIVDKVMQRNSRESMMKNRENFLCVVEARGLGTELKGKLWKVMEKDREGYNQMKLSEREMAILNAQMKEKVGFASFEEMKAHVVEDQERRFGNLK